MGRRRALDLQPLQRLDLKEAATTVETSEARCDGCEYARRRAADTSSIVVCVCERIHAPPKRVFRFEPARDIPLLVRWLPELLARSPGFVRATGSPGHNGSSSSAHGGRLDHVDESRAYSRAVETLRHLRACVARDLEASVAILWAVYALVPEQEDVRRQHLSRCNAVALGAAPSTLRAMWRERAAERDRTAIVNAPFVVTDGAGEEREVVRRSVAILSTKGPTFEAQALRWGAEHLAVLWSPNGVPDAEAHGVALGFAPPAERATWERSRASVREAAVRSWAEALLVEAVARTEVDRATDV